MKLNNIQQCGNAEAEWCELWLFFSWNVSSTGQKLDKRLHMVP